MRKWVSCENLLLDARFVVEFLEFCEGKVLNAPKLRAVKTGGDDADGNPVERPTARAFVLKYAETVKRWRLLNAVTAAREFGFSKGAIYTAHKVLTDGKTLKRVGAGEYELRVKAAKKHAPKPKPASKIGKPTNGTAAVTQ